MPIISTIDPGGPGGSASASEYTLIEELLSQLPDNIDYQILPVHIRNAVYTLWEKLGNNTGWTFSNSNTTLIDVGGIDAGTTFNSALDVQQMFDLLLYPYIAASASITGGTLKEFGNPSNTVTLSWNVEKKSDDIATITVDGTSVTPNGGNQSGTKVGTATINVNKTFSLVVTDTPTATTTSAFTYVTWSHAIYWGTHSSTNVNTLPLTVVSGLKPPFATGAGVGTGKELTSTFEKTFDGINAQGQYLVFMWPTTYESGGAPSFKTNNVVNTAFTRYTKTYTNAYGYATSYYVYISDYAQNSPIELFEIYK